MLKLSQALVDRIYQESPLSSLLEAKGYSDQRQYPRKHAILRKMIEEDPDSFFVDSRDEGIVGLTHKPTGFRIHMPLPEVPPEFRTAYEDGQTKAAADEKRAQTKLTVRRLINITARRLVTR